MWPRPKPISPRRQRQLFAVFLSGLAAFHSSRSGVDGDGLINLHVALRHWGGQFPYRDFLVPHGAVSGALLAFIGVFFPSAGAALVFASILLNIAATLLIENLVWEITHDPDRSAAAAILTALWYLPIFGTYYHDHLAFLLGLVAYSAWRGSHRRGAWFAGLFLALSFHAKQTVGAGLLAAGIFSQHFFPSKTTSRDKTRDFWLGLVITHLAFFSFWGFTQAWRPYLEAAVKKPIFYASQSAWDKNPVRALMMIFFPYHINPWRMIREWGMGRMFFYPVVLAVYGALIVLWRHRQEKSQATSGLAFTLLGTLWGAALLGRLYAHLFFALGAAVPLAWHIYRRQRTAGPCETLSYFVLTACAVVQLLHLHPWRVKKVPELANSQIGLLRLAPTAQRNAAGRIFQLLRQRTDHDAIAVFGDEAALVPLALGEAPINPTVIYNGVTLPSLSETKSWEKRFINALERHHARYLIASRPLAAYPDLDLYLRTHYRKIMAESEMHLLESKL